MPTTTTPPVIPGTVDDELLAKIGTPVAAKPQVPDTVDELIAQTGAQESESQSAVLDVSLFDKQQRAVQYLQYAGLIAGDANLTTLNVLKRVNRAAFAAEDKGKISQLQEQFRAQMAGMDIAALTAGGAESPVFKLVDNYLAERVAHYKNTVAELDALPSTLSTDEFNRTRHRALEYVSKYEKERAYYTANPEIINDAVRQNPKALTTGIYLPLGRLAFETGMIKGEASKVYDMIDDTMANAAAHSMLHVAEEVMSTSDADLAINQRFPDRYRANIMAKATDTAATTTPIDKLKIFDDTTPQVARIQALKKLLSAHLHAMTSYTRDAAGNSTPPPAELAEALVKIKPLVRKYQSATMSLAYHFLGEGAGKDDARMQKLREHLVTMMEKNQIPLLMDRAEAERASTAAAEESAAYLRLKAEKSLTNIDALMALAVPGMAAKYATPPAASFAEAAANRAGASPAVGA